MRREVWGMVKKHADEEMDTPVLRGTLETV